MQSKDFQDFRKSLRKEIITQWDAEIRKHLDESMDDDYGDNPIEWQFAYNQSFAIEMNMRILEAYHNWLHQ